MHMCTGRQTVGHTHIPRHTSDTHPETHTHTHILPDVCTHRHRVTDTDVEGTAESHGMEHCKDLDGVCAM